MQAFIYDIEREVYLGLTYAESICAVAERYNFEMEDVIKLLPKNIIDQLENEARKNKTFKKQFRVDMGQLPF